MNVYLLIQLLIFYFFFFTNKKSLEIIEKNHYQKLFIMEKIVNKKLLYEKEALI